MARVWCKRQCEISPTSSDQPDPRHPDPTMQREAEQDRAGASSERRRYWSNGFRPPFRRPPPGFSAPSASSGKQRSAWRSLRGWSNAAPSSQQAEQQPAARSSDSSVRRSRQNGLQREGSEQGEAEHEAAVQIRPERHQRQQRQRRRAIAVAGGEQASRPAGQHGQSQDMRPGQQAAGPAAPRPSVSDHDQRRAVEVARQPSRPTGEAGGRHRRRRSGRRPRSSRPAGRTQRQQDLRQPFMRGPRTRPGQGKGEGIGRRARLRWARIHSPAAMCQKVSPSFSTAGNDQGRGRRSSSAAAAPGSVRPRRRRAAGETPDRRSDFRGAYASIGHGASRASGAGTGLDGSLAARR